VNIVLVPHPHPLVHARAREPKKGEIDRTGRADANSPESGRKGVKSAKPRFEPGIGVLTPFTGQAFASVRVSYRPRFAFMKGL
jgi:hypothetical protein